MVDGQPLAGNRTSMSSAINNVLHIPLNTSSPGLAGGGGGPHNPSMEVMDYRMDQVEKRMDRLDGRLDHMDGTLTEIKILIANIPSTGKMQGIVWSAAGTLAALILALIAVQHSAFQTGLSAVQTVVGANQSASPAPQIHIVPVSPPQTASPPAKP